jgi:hypothetical protein
MSYRSSKNRLATNSKWNPPMKMRQRARAKKFNDWLRRLKGSESMSGKFDTDSAHMQSPEFAQIAIAKRARLGRVGFRPFGERSSARSLEETLAAVSERSRSKD